jgi:hypothetical protein
MIYYQYIQQGKQCKQFTEANLSIPKKVPVRFLALKEDSGSKFGKKIYIKKKNI